MFKLWGGLAVLVTVSGLTASSCALSEDVAATYDGSEIPTSVVDALVTDEAFAALQGVSVGEDEKVLDATSARGVLDVLLETEALTSEVQEQGLELDSGDAAAQFVQQQQDQGFAFGMDDFAPETRKVLERYFGAQQVLQQNNVALPAATEQDLRFVYDELAVDGAWEQTCLTLVAAAPTDEPAISAALDDGVELSGLAEVAPTVQVVFDPGTQCVSGTDLGQLPPELTEAISSAPERELQGPMTVAGADGTDVLVFFEVDSTKSMSFEDARAQLESLVASSSLAVRIARNSEINPRYGDGVALEVATSQAGATGLRATVQRPSAPDPTDTPTT